MQAHPLRAAWQTRDLDAWAGALAEDVELHSPVFRMPFRGREAVIELFGVLFDALGNIDITDELVADHSHALFWHADVGGRRIEGADLLRSDEHGKITEIRVLIRPLADIAVFAAAAGPPLAAKRGSGRALLLRFLTLPLKAILLAADAVASRLLHRR